MRIQPTFARLRAAERRCALAAKNHPPVRNIGQIGHIRRILPRIRLKPLPLGMGMKAGRRQATDVPAA